MKKLIALIILLSIMGNFTISVNAQSNFNNYNYNTKGKAVDAPQSYAVKQILYGDESTNKVFASPKDICTDVNGNLYVLDSGNNRLVVYNSDLSLKFTVDSVNVDGKELPLSSCTGIYVANNEIYLADKDNGLIYVLSLSGIGNRVISFVPQPVVDENFVYRPTRLTVDDKGIMQVRSEGCYNGLITLDKNGEMIGYFSANTVQASFSVITAQFWRKIFSDEQQDSIKQIIPTEYSSLTMDNQGFIYTVTKTTENSTFEIKKLNPYGDNILGYNNNFPSIKIGNGNYGDLSSYRSGGTTVDTAFCDIYVDDRDFIFALDATRGRIFSYDQNSNLVSIFGGMGDQTGTFSEPIAIDGYKEDIYVLDATKGTVTVFSAMDYVKYIRDALILDSECEYDKALEYWNKVYDLNCNYSLALSGIGKAAYKNNEIKKALEFFKAADDRANYDLAYTTYRTQTIRENFPIIAISIIVIIAGVLVSIKIISKRRRGKW